MRGEDGCSSSARRDLVGMKMTRSVGTLVSLEMPCGERKAQSRRGEAARRGVGGGGDERIVDAAGPITRRNDLASFKLRTQIHATRTKTSFLGGETAAPSATRPGPPHTRRGGTGIAQLTRDKTPHPSRRPPSHAHTQFNSNPAATQRVFSASAAHATAVAWPTAIARRISDAAATCTATEMCCITNG